MKLLAKIFALFAVLVLILEISLRVYGLGSWIVYAENSSYEYFQIPNLNFKRFSNQYSTNSLGMRASNEVSAKGLRILKFGDSVLNGGAKVSDEECLSAVVQDSLQSIGFEASVFNISAGSWGPENAFQYFQKHIEWKPDAIVLVFSSHDYSDNMHFKHVVGFHPNWPDKQPYLAIQDLWGKWLKYRLGNLINYRFEELHYLDDVSNTQMNPGWNLFHEYSTQNNIPFIIYLHPEKTELESKSWNKNGRNLLTWFQTNDITYIDGLELGYLSNSYVDNIHLNEKGHKSIAQNIFPSLINSIQQKSD